MSDVEINELDELPQPSKRPAQRRNGNEALAQRARPRGLIQQITTVLMRPAAFFYGVGQGGDSRQWVIVALLIVALIGTGAVRHQTALNGGGAAVTPQPEFEGGGDFGGGEFGGGGDFGGPPPGVVPNSGGGAVASATTTADLTTSLIAGADVVMGWFILALLLLLVPMFNGRAPKFGMALQVAVWSSVPLAVMAVAQWLYYAGGGTPGGVGLTGLLPEFEFYTGASPFMQAVMQSAAGKLTLFWLWSIVLVQFGGRYTLGGKRFIVPIIVALWVVVQIFAPVLSGKITVESPEPTPIDDGGMMPMPEGELPFEVTPEAESEAERPIDAPPMKPIR